MPAQALIAHGVTLALCVAMLVVIYTDATRYIITNRLNIAIAALYGLAALLLPLDWQGALIAAGLMLAVGLLIFYLNVMGGGDVKLLVVLMLWTGWSKASLNLIFLTSVLGGVLVIGLLLLRVIVPRMALRLCPTRNVPRVLQPGQPVPYGLAIASTFLWMVWQGMVPGLPALSALM